MSVVAAKVYDKEVIMAADSILIKGSSKRNNNFTKILKLNDMIIGSVGLAEELSLMWHYMETHKPAAANEKSILEFFSEFSQWKCGKGAGPGVENTYLMIFDGHLFEIERMLAFEIKDYSAIGAGEDFSNAALYLGHSPREAVKVACDLSCFVCEPIIEYSMERKV